MREGPQKGLRVLAPLEDLGRALVSSLDEKQRSLAVIEAVAPGDILTMNKLDISPLSPAGLAGSAMTTDQRAALTRLIEAYATMVADDLAADRLAKVKATGPDQVTFAWAGPVEKGAKHYYRVQGPGFLIEYDNTQNDGNHIHAVWRDFQGDFGRDLLREHLKEVRARIARETISATECGAAVSAPHIGLKAGRLAGQTRLRGDQALGQTRLTSLGSNMPSRALRRVCRTCDRPNLQRPSVRRGTARQRQCNGRTSDCPAAPRLPRHAT